MVNILDHDFGLSTEEVKAQINQDVEEKATRGISDAGVPVREKEHIVFARILDFSQLKLARKAEVQEQYGVSIERSDANAGSGKIRIRKITPRNGHVRYEMTTKSDVKEGKIEVTIPTTEANFIQMKVLADKGMIKHRYFYPVKGTQSEWEVDAIPDGNGGYLPWIRAELEVDDLKEALPEFPLKTEEIIFPPQFSEMSEEEYKEKTDQLYNRFFLINNPLRKDIDNQTKTELKGVKDEVKENDTVSEEGEEKDSSEDSDAKKELSVDNITDNKQQADAVEARSDEIKEAKGIEDEDAEGTGDGTDTSNDNALEASSDDSEDKTSEDDTEGDKDKQNTEEGKEDTPKWEDDDKSVSKENLAFTGLFGDDVSVSTESLKNTLSNGLTNLIQFFTGIPAYENKAQLKGIAFKQDIWDGKNRVSRVLLPHDKLQAMANKKNALDELALHVIKASQTNKDVPFFKEEYHLDDKMVYPITVGAESEWKKIKPLIEAQIKEERREINSEAQSYNFDESDPEFIGKIAAAQRRLFTLICLSSIANRLGKTGEEQEVSKEDFIATLPSSVIGYLSLEELREDLDDNFETTDGDEDFNPLFTPEFSDVSNTDIQVDYGENEDISWYSDKEPEQKDSISLRQNSLIETFFPVKEIKDQSKMSYVFNNQEGLLSIFLAKNTWVGYECLENRQDDFVKAYFEQHQEPYANLVNLFPNYIAGFKQWVRDVKNKIDELSETMDWTDRQEIAQQLQMIPVMDDVRNDVFALLQYTGQDYFTVNPRNQIIEGLKPVTSSSLNLLFDQEIEFNTTMAGASCIPVESQVAEHPVFRDMIQHLSTAFKCDHKEAAILLYHGLFKAETKINQFLKIVDLASVRWAYYLATVTMTTKSVNPEFDSKLDSGWSGNIKMIDKVQ